MGLLPSKSRAAFLLTYRHW